MIFRKKEEKALEVIIGAESSIKGDLFTKGFARLDGTVEGAVKADWLIIGETGAVKGEVNSRGAVVNGKVKGNIDSREIVEIKSKGSVEGDIRTTTLIISEGAFFEGHSHMDRSTGNDDKEQIFSFEQKAKKAV